MKMRSITPAIAVAVMTCVGLAADDKWETSPGWYTDDDGGTPNQLIHGVPQTHDIEGPASAGPSDLDFSYVAAKARHSYEVRVFNTNSCFQQAASCADVSRVALDGATVLTAGIRPDGQLDDGGAGWLAVRWTSTANQYDLIKVHGYVGAAATAASQYDIQMLDTTYLVPRWNNSGTQITILLIQNGSNAPIAGSIFFYNASGAVLHTQPLSLPANGLQVVSTVGIPALAGASGTAAITHDGGYGALAGKAVALEPSTGFAFDTAITPIPY
jgi:hypothetical protein